MEKEGKFPTKKYVHVELFPLWTFAMVRGSFTIEKSGGLKCDKHFVKKGRKRQAFWQRTVSLRGWKWVSLGRKRNVNWELKENLEESVLDFGLISHKKIHSSTPVCGPETPGQVSSCLRVFIGQCKNQGFKTGHGDPLWYVPSEN